MYKKTGLIALLVLFSAGFALAEENNITSEGPISDYIVIPSKSDDQSVTVLKVSDTIAQRETNWHYKTVSSSITTLNIDLNWRDTSDSLRLTIYSPDGHVFGPYYDSADGSANGRINLDITNSNGIAKGTWRCRIYGYRVTGTQSYTI